MQSPTINIAQYLHFYQPRNNDPFTTKINEECYKPLAQAGVFEHIGFNIGPTLIDWLADNDKETLDRIVESDKGQACAQPYSHRIMPLIRHDEDITTQIRWGKEHFKKYFKREPKGMWLPETATSKRVLNKLAEEGIEYTIGAQNQNAKNDSTDKVYEVKLDDGKKIKYFIFNNVSSRIAYNQGRAKNGGRYLDNVEKTLYELKEKEENFMLLAYDGETFGHHHTFAEHWLEYFPKGVEKVKGLDLIMIHELNGQFKEEGMIHEDSSWSCLCGGLKRWTDGCGCAGSEMGYKRPLFEVVMQQEDIIHDIFEREGTKILKDPWEARNDYIHLILKTKDWNTFMKEHFKNNSEKAQQKIKHLLKAEYHTQLSATSCGWFFENIHPQTRNNIMDLQKAAEHVKKAIGTDVSQNVKGIEWMLNHVS